eukprot:480980-Ditylum_brightwellii.AAC.1
MPSSHHPNGFHYKEVCGLMSAGATDPSCSTPGYVVFVCSGKNTIEKDNDMESEDGNFEDDEIDLGTGMKNSVQFYADNILLKFIESQQSDCCYNDSENDCDDKFSNAWFYGDVNQPEQQVSRELIWAT